MVGQAMGKPNYPNGCQFSKTKLCRFELVGRCTKGLECPFAHGAGDLREQPDLRCTKMCMELLQTGSCNNKDCTFAHSRSELRSAWSNSSRKAKWNREEKIGSQSTFGSKGTFATPSALELDTADIKNTFGSKGTFASPSALELDTADIKNTFGSKGTFAPPNAVELDIADVQRKFGSKRTFAPPTAVELDTIGIPQSEKHVEDPMKVLVNSALTATAFPSLANGPPPLPPLPPFIANSGLRDYWDDSATRSTTFKDSRSGSDASFGSYADSPVADGRLFAAASCLVDDSPREPAYVPLAKPEVAAPSPMSGDSDDNVEERNGFDFGFGYTCFGLSEGASGTLPETKFPGWGPTDMFNRGDAGWLVNQPAFHGFGFSVDGSKDNAWQMKHAPIEASNAAAPEFGYGMVPYFGATW